MKSFWTWAALLAGAECVCVDFGGKVIGLKRKRSKLGDREF